MSHGIGRTDTMVSTGNEVPWHGLGTVVKDEALDAATMMRLAKLDWTVHKEPIYRPKKNDQGEVTITRVKGFNSIVRDRDDRDLGIVKEAYQPIQNVDLFRFFDPIVAAGTAMYHTAGSLFDGERVWALVQLPGEIRLGGGDDTINKFVLLTTSHNGGGSMIVKPTPVRVVCNNTLTLALRTGSKYNGNAQVNGISIRHLGDIEAAMREGVEALGAVNKLYEELNEVYSAMRSKTLNEADTMEYLKRCLRVSARDADTDDLGDDGGDDEKAEKLPRTLNRVVGLLETGKGTDLPGVKGTLWGAYNAITEDVDHKDTYRSGDTRLANALFNGAGQSVKNRALKEAKLLLKV